MKDYTPIPVYVNNFWAVFNLVRGMAYSIQIIVLYDNN